MELLSVFIIFPLGAVLIGVGFAIAAWRRRRVLPGIAAILWCLYGVYEFLMYTRVLCTGECNIRIDLLIIYPVLLLVTLLGLIGVFWRKKSPK